MWCSWATMVSLCPVSASTMITTISNYLEIACQALVLATSTGVALKIVDTELAQRVADLTNGERLQSELIFGSLRRMRR